MKPMAWQENCLTQYRKNKKKDFVLVAGTGCGKTVAGVLCAIRSVTDAKSLGHNPLVLVVCPYRSIRIGWQKKFEDKGLGVAKDPIEVAEDTEVVISTYAGAGNLLSYIIKHMDRKLIIIFDEFHHMEETNKWANPFVNMEPERYFKRIFLSGTPWHEQGKLPESMVTYNEKGEVKADFLYTYGENVNEEEDDRNTVPVIFRPKRILVEQEKFDIETGFELDKEEHDSEKKTRSDSIAPFVRFEDVVELSKCDGLVSLLNDAVSELNSIRSMAKDEDGMHKAGGIIFVQDKKRGEAVKALMESHFNKPALLVSSDDPQSHAEIERFKDNGDEWIISIDMVSEGVDIPRLKVVADLSNRMTMMHIIQRWGRVLRRLREDNGRFAHNTEARIFYINHPQLQHVAEYIEEDIRRNKRKVENKPDAPEPPPKYAYGQAEQFYEDRQVVFKGATLNEQVSMVADWIEKTNFNSVISDGLKYRGALNLARYLIANHEVPDEVFEEEPPMEEPVLSMSVRKQAAVKAYSRVTHRIAYRFFNSDFKEAMKYVNKRQGIHSWSKNHKTLEQLEGRLEAAKAAEQYLSSVVK